jgi:hypothetical protein
VRQVDHLPELYEDAWSEKYKTFSDAMFFQISLTILFFDKDRTYYRQFIHRAS